MKRLILLLVLSLATSTSAFAQGQAGSITGTVKDTQGGVRPNVTVLIEGVDVRYTTVTDARGDYRFLNLANGPYKLTVDTTDMIAVAEAVVEVGRNVDLPIELQIVGGKEIVTVIGPIVDITATGTQRTISRKEIDLIPNPRDLFSLPRSVAGVLSDQVNATGTESGQQPVLLSKGSRGQDTVFMLDGLEMTDMGAPGFSPIYLTPDGLDEVQISTAGQDIRSRTGGLNINIITKRGGNQFSGGARSYFSNDSLQSSNVPSELKLLTVPVTSKTADHTVQNADYGFDAGGPLLRGRLWAYASMSQQDIRLYRRTTSAIDRTTLKTPQVKITWQASKQNVVDFLFLNGYKIKDGRTSTANASTFETFDATHHQDNAYSDAPLHGMWKLGINRIFDASTFLSAKYAYHNTGIKLTPEGGMEVQAGRNANAPTRAYGSTIQSLQIRPQHAVTADANHFTELFGLHHEFKAGFGFRRVLNSTKVAWPGNGIVAIEQVGGTGNRAQVFRESDGANILRYVDAYVGDALLLNRVRIDFGVRYDRQWGEALASTTPGSKAFPETIPGVIFAGYDAPFTWQNFSPRVGLTYTLDSQGHTVARASYSRFVSQLAASTVGIRNLTTVSTPGNATYRWTDLNGDHYAQPGEVDLNNRLATGGGFDPANPTAVASINQVDSNLKAPIGQSVVVGIEHQLAKHMAVMVDYSYNRDSRLFGNLSANLTPRLGTSLDSYIPGDTLVGTLPDGTAYSVPTFKLNLATLPSGNVTRNVPDFYTDYHGLEVNLVKRLADGWMGRVMFSYNNAREHFTSPAGRYNTNGNPTPTPGEPLVDGGQMAPTANLSGGVFLNAKWQFNANGMWVAPYGIEVAGNVFGRQGYPFPIYRGSISLGVETGQNILVSPRIDSFRLDDVWNTDLRVARTFRLRTARAPLTVRLMADVFNVVNSNTELSRVGNTGADGLSTAFKSLSKNLSPRILRFGLAVGF